MKIGIIGAGRMGRALGRRWARAGHDDDARVARAKPDVVYCGDDDEAKSIAATLARDAGFNPLDAGALEIARYLEPFGLLVAQLAYEQELGETMGYRFLTPNGK
jgi:predicted dinucleotide-binding enzyme